ncbi:MAG: serine/threonine protein kinase [Deltaproteobacteria bacterium]|nr:MAG: serine/threonine protein kinase [Deltaproteobacteria bacterium]
MAEQTEIFEDDDFPFASPEALWVTLGFEENTPTLNSRGTLVKQDSTGDALAHLTLEQLPKLMLASDASEEELQRHGMAELDLKETLGEGGMGVIQRATQLPLRREVAVKRLRDGLDAPKQHLALLREAWITGLLEHPNIVPIHVLGRAPNGAPMFAMKRIEGVPWSALMNNPEHPMRKDDSSDPLGWNINILLQLCNAVSFAHSRGIVHRDLKPENVMVGSFGEVYLLDWGIAVSIDPDEERPIPKASEVANVSGTPGYMAPEMVDFKTRPISAATDVYQLGAILHEVVTGHPRHLGDNLMDTLFQAYQSEAYAYKDSVPRELAAICNTATHRDPSQRYQTVDALRKAILEFLKHRDSIRLSDEATRTLGKLRRLVLKGGEASNDVNHRARVYGLFSECRFGFEQSIRAWAQNPQAIQGMQDASGEMAAFEIEQGDLNAATMYYNLLRNPSETLTGRYQALVEESKRHEEELAQLQKLKEDRDFEVGRRTRSFISVLGGALYVPLLLSFGTWWNLLSFNYVWHLVCSGLFVGYVLFVTVWARDTMTKTAFNRGVLRSLWLMGAVLVAEPFGTLFLGIPARESFTQTFLLFSVFVGMGTATLERRLLFSFVVYLATYLAMSFYPAFMFEIAALGHCLALFWIGLVWRPEQLFRPPENLLRRYEQVIQRYEQAIKERRAERRAERDS